MSPNERLDGEALRLAAREAVKAAGLSQRAVAERLGLAESWVSRALNTAGTKYAGAQSSIIEALTEYTVEPETAYILRRKG